MRKKLISILIISMSFLLTFATPSYARAGGGGGGGSGGSHGSHRSHRNTYHDYDDYDHYRHRNNPNLFTIMMPLLLLSPAILVFNFRLIKAKIKTKHSIEKKNLNYNDIEKRIKESYFAVQEAWANNSMSDANDYMTPELLQSFKMKLNWMKISGKNNVMKNIRLLNAYPISLSSYEGDQMWVYIKGKMVDYILDTNKNKIIEGSSISSSFIEYWLFKKNKNNQWVLSQILQKNELSKIKF